jgi:ribose transport system permease protein
MRRPKVNMERPARFAQRRPWVWSALGALAVWAALSIISGRGVLTSLEAAFELGAFLALIGLGQLFVITSGNGNIDLSLPNIITLSGYIGVGAMGGLHGSVARGVLLGLGVGIAVAIANVAAIMVLGIPPIVATLSVGLLVQSFVLSEASNFNGQAPNGAHAFMTDRLVGGIPLIGVLAVLATVVGAVLLHRTKFGREVQAVGQNLAAAKLSGIRVTRVVVGCYLISGFLAAVVGVGLSVFTGPSPTLGDPYLLESVGVVVLGGSLIAGGQSNISGVWGAAFFLNLVITLCLVLHLSVALQYVVEGILIIAVLSLAGGKRWAASG